MNEPTPIIAPKTESSADEITEVDGVHRLYLPINDDETRSIVHRFLQVTHEHRVVTHDRGVLITGRGTVQVHGSADSP
jgi:hypothetical protein